MCVHIYIYICLFVCIYIYIYVCDTEAMRFPFPARELSTSQDMGVGGERSAYGILPYKP